MCHQNDTLVRRNRLVRFNSLPAWVFILSDFNLVLEVNHKFYRAEKNPAKIGSICPGVNLESIDSI